MTTRALCAFGRKIFLRDLRAFVVKIVFWLRLSRAGVLGSDCHYPGVRVAR